MYGVRSTEYGVKQRAGCTLSRLGTRYAVRGTKKCGFTLVEVMVATVVLALGIVLVYESFFISLNSFTYYTHYLGVASWMNQKVWEAQDGLSRLGSAAVPPAQDTLTIGSQSFNWNLHAEKELSDISHDLYKIGLVVSWKEGKRNPQLTRTAYAIVWTKEVQ